MFGKRFPLFRLFGFKVYADLSWLILAVLITWSLAVSMFPFYFPRLSPAQYWWMGGAGALGLFLSIVLHEMTHSLVARRYGLPMKGITLFIFGGVAEMNEEPPSARAEFAMAIAGPISSLVIAAACVGVNATGKRMGWPLTLTGVIDYLAFINVALAVFNLIPAFPLDGGRVLRSALWGWKGDIRWATRIASQLGTGFAWGLIVLGAWRVLVGNFIGGMWWFLIGMFLKGAAGMAYRQVLLRETLRGETVRRFMSGDPVTVPPSLSLKRFVEDFVYRYHFKMFPVVDEGRLVGCVTTKDIRDIPREEWDGQTVSAVARPCAADNSVGPDTDAMEALGIMSRTGNSRLLVVEGGRLVGIIALKDLLRFFALKMDIEGEEDFREAA